MSELSTLSRHCFCPIAHARARGPLPFKLRRSLTPVSPFSPPPSPHPLADWPPVSSFRGSSQPPSSRFECRGTNPFTRPGSHPDIYPRVRLPPPSTDKVKSYGSVKAILSLHLSISLFLRAPFSMLPRCVSPAFPGCGGLHSGRSMQRLEIF